MRPRLAKFNTHDVEEEVAPSESHCTEEVMGLFAPNAEHVCSGKLGLQRRIYSRKFCLSANMRLKPLPLITVSGTTYLSVSNLTIGKDLVIYVHPLFRLT